MPEYLQKLIPSVLAAIFGWLFISLPKVARRSMTWTVMLASIGLAGVVGFITGSIVSYFLPSLPPEMVCSLGAVAGAYCDQWMNRFMQLSSRAADRLEEVVLERIGDTEPIEKPPIPEDQEQVPEKPSGDPT